MTDANIWMLIVGILYVIPVFWLLDGFEEHADMAGSRWLAVLWVLAVLAVLAWPVLMIVDMMSGGEDD
jgi:hypothetical protein